MNVARIAVSAVVGLFLAAGCSMTATDGQGQAGSGEGELGDGCTCTTEQPECVPTGSGCAPGLTCASPSIGARHSCTRTCPCPLGFRCQPSAAGALRCFR